MSTPAAPGLQIGTIAGAPVRIGASWLVLAAVVIVTSGSNLARAGVSTSTAYLVAASYAGVLLVSVLLHEIAHALSARRAGLPVTAVVADLWGGHTTFDGSRLRPGTSAVVAAAGPATNLALGLAAWAGAEAAGDGIPGHILGAAGYANILLAVFNLIPGLPLDGGQILEAAVWRATGVRHRGTIVAAWGGRVVAILVVAWAVLLPLVRGAGLTAYALWALLIAWFLWRGASASLLRAEVTQRFTGHPLSATVHPLVAVPADSLLSSAGDVRLPAFVMDGGLPVGLLTADALGAVPLERHASTPVRAVLTREPDVWVIDATGDELLPVVQQLAMRQLPYAAVRRDGVVLGLLDGRDVQRLLGD